MSEGNGQANAAAAPQGGGIVAKDKIEIYVNASTTRVLALKLRELDKLLSAADRALGGNQIGIDKYMELQAGALGLVSTLNRVLEDLRSNQGIKQAADALSGRRRMPKRPLRPGQTQYTPQRQGQGKPGAASATGSGAPKASSGPAPAPADAAVAPKGASTPTGGADKTPAKASKKKGGNGAAKPEVVAAETIPAQPHAGTLEI